MSDWMKAYHLRPMALPATDPAIIWYIAIAESNYLAHKSTLNDRRLPIESVSNVLYLFDVHVVRWIRYTRREDLSCYRIMTDAEIVNNILLGTETEVIQYRDKLSRQFGEYQL